MDPSLDSRLGVIREDKRVNKGAKRGFEEAVNVDCLKNRFLKDVSDEITTFRGHRNPKTDLKSSRTSILRPHNSNLNFDNEKRELKTVNNEIIEIAVYFQGVEREPGFLSPPPAVELILSVNTKQKGFRPGFNHVTETIY